MESANQKALRRQNLSIRAKSAIFIVSFYIGYLLLLFFSNEHWFKPLNDLSLTDMHSVQFVLGFLNVLTLAPIIYFVSKELANLCFPGRRRIFVYTLCSLFVLTFGMSIYLLGTRYDFFPQTKISLFNCFELFILVSFLGVVFFSITSTCVWIYMSRHIVYVGQKTRIWYPILITLMNTFFVGFVYTTIIHTWTTYMFLMASSVFCDVFAYLGGVKFGKHKMAPKISPKKSWEGLIIGTVVTLLILCGIFGLFHLDGAEKIDNTLYKFLGCQTCLPGDNLKAYFWAIYILAIIVIMAVSIFGDLFFSYIKRKFNIKDFGNLIPGHGGMLDRLDALIFVFGFYYLVTIFCQLICIFIDRPMGIEVLWENQSLFAF